MMDKSVSKGVIILAVIVCPTLTKKYLYASDIWPESMSKLRNSRKV